MQNTVGFLGGGNMATALIRGLIAQGIDAAKIWVYDRNTEKSTHLNQAFGIQIAATQDQLLAAVETIVLAVKPQSMAEACAAFNAAAMLKPLLWISIAAGLRIETIENFMHTTLPLVRAMPNTPAMCGLGATGLYANAKVMPAGRSIAENIFNAVGCTVWATEESQIDKITALSGSGPAYFFFFFESLLAAAVQAGMAPDVARMLIVQTARGATAMAEENAEWLTLRQQVTSRGGTTEAGIAVLEAAHFQKTIKEMFDAAAHRAHMLSEKT